MDTDLQTLTSGCELNDQACWHCLADTHRKLSASPQANDLLSDQQEMTSVLPLPFAITIPVSARKLAN
jgi:hypothetical protein